MARRKNTKFIDPRYFMDEKTEIIKEDLNEISAKQRAHEKQAGSKRAWRAKADERARELGWPNRARWSDGDDPNNPDYVGYWIQDNDTQEHIENVPEPK